MFALTAFEGGEDGHNHWYFYKFKVFFNKLYKYIIKE